MRGASEKSLFLWERTCECEQRTSLFPSTLRASSSGPKASLLPSASRSVRRAAFRKIRDARTPRHSLSLVSGGREGGRKQNLLLHRRTQWSRSSPPPPCRVRRAATPFPPPGTRMLSMSRPSVLYRRRTCGSPSSEERRTASTRVTRSHPPSLVTQMGPSRIYRTLLFETNTLHFGPSPIPSTAKQGFAFFSAPEN